MVKILKSDDVIRLLRQYVEQAGGQSAWSRKTGVNRTVLNKVLNGDAPVTASIIGALNLQVVYAFKGRRR